MSRTRLLLVGVGVACSTALAAATAIGGAAARPSAAAAADLAYVKAQIQKYSAIPPFTLKAATLDYKKARGKVIFNIPINSADPYNATIDKGQAVVAKELGLKFIEFPDTGQPTQWQQGIQQAVARKVNVIHLVGADPYILRPQIAAATKAGIPVVSSRLFDLHQPFPPFVTSTIGVDFGRAGRLEADWAILDTKGKADVLIVASMDVRSGPYMVKAIQNEFATRCPACKVKVVPVGIADWATKMQTATQSALTADPGVNYIVPVYDSMSQFIIPAITTTGRTGKVFISTYNGTPFVLKLLAQGNTVRMDVGEDLDWLARAQMDLNLRVLLHSPPVRDEHMALRVFTKANVGETGNPPAYNLGFGNAYIQGYNKLWGVTK